MKRTTLLVPGLALAALACSSKPGPTRTRPAAVHSVQYVDVAPPPAPPAPPGAPHGPDPVADALYPPELIMMHQSEIGISDKQRQAIISAIQDMQKKMVALQWSMQGARETLVGILRTPRVDEAKAMTAAGHVMDIEANVKKAHLDLLVRIKNQLTEKQQKELDQVKRHMRARMPPPALPGPPAPRPPGPPPVPGPPQLPGR